MSFLINVILFSVLIVCVFGKKEKLTTKVVYIPEVCKHKSENGQMLSMHYVGTLASDGSKFDSR